ncbi:Ribonucleoside-diphosphate reductase large subunit-like protein [Trichinella pseudospiralis]
MVGTFKMMSEWYLQLFTFHTFVADKLALVCMYTVDLKIECQVMSAREIPRHNNSDNDLTKLGS